MKSRELWTAVLYTILFVALFIVLKVIALVITNLIVSFIHGTPFLTTMNGVKDGTSIALSAVISSLLTLLLFTRTKWAPVSNLYLKSRPWGVLLWAALLALGSILPMEFIAEKINLTMPEQAEAMFQSIMKTSWGYIALGIMAPLAEEVVFRGGVLRVLLNATGSKNHWIAIILSALVFGFIHFNLAQGIHAFLLGLVLGWMYYRTKSILPGLMLHWMNNTVAYVMFHLMPQMSDGKLIDFFHGSERMMYGGLFFSLCILIPSIFQLALRMKKA